MVVYASRLKKGDEIRVISPSRSLSIIRPDVYDKALEFLEKQGYKVTFSSHGTEIEYMESSSISSRIEDLHNAFLDKNVKAILTSVGGFNANQLLDEIDYSIIKKNPKIVCGYSDATVLLNAIYAKTGLVTYNGPHFSSFGFEENRAYTTEYFEKCVMTDDNYVITPSKEASSYVTIQEGESEGIIVGGNLCSFNLLQGTKFFPKMQKIILFLEDDNIMGKYFVPEFERNLQSLLQTKNCQIKGVVFGRFSDDCLLDKDMVCKIVKSKKQLRDVPIIFNADFGHIFPFFTFPIGGVAKIVARKSKAEIYIKSH